MKVISLCDERVGLVGSVSNLIWLINFVSEWISLRSFDVQMHKITACCAAMFGVG